MIGGSIENLSYCYKNRTKSLGTIYIVIRLCARIRFVY